MSKVILTTPPVLVVGKSHLALPDMNRAEKFPKIGKDGSNTNMQYALRVGFVPTRDKEHKDFLELLFHKEAFLKSTSDVLYSIIKPKKLFNKETKEWSEDPDDKTVEFRSRQPIIIKEGENIISGDKLLLDPGTTVKIQFELTEYDFEIEGKGNIKGIKLYPKEIMVLARPKRESWFNREKNNG